MTGRAERRNSPARRLFRRARSARALLIADVVVGVAMAVLVLVQAGLLAHVATAAFEGDGARAVAGGLALLATVFALRGGLAWLFEVLGRRAAAGAMSELRMALLASRLRGRPLATDGAEGGEIAAAAVQGVEGLEAFFARFLPQALLAVIVPALVLIRVAALDATSAAVMFLTLPLVPVFMWLIGARTAQHTRERWRTMRLLSTHFLDVVRGLPTLRAFNRGRAQAAVIADVSERYRRATMQTLRLSFLSGTVLELAATLGVALVAVTLGVRLVDGGIGLEAALTVLVLAPELYLPLRTVGARYHDGADGLAVAERILDLIDLPPAVGSGGSVAPPSPGAAPVRFEGVTYRYPARDARVLEGLDLELPPGCTTALVGESGAGKSTVAALVLGLIAPAAGRITVGGVDLADCDADAWRRMLAWVPQDPVMLRGTVADNVRLGAPDADDGAVRRALALAGADGVVDALPDGLETVIGEGGRVLSPGERRRIAIARAVLRDAGLLVLDEPTADLDPASAGAVGEAVARLRGTRTILLIAHRPELAALADRTVTLTRPATPGGVPA